MAFDLLWLVEKFIAAGAGPVCLHDNQRLSVIRNLGLPDAAIRMVWWRENLAGALEKERQFRRPPASPPSDSLRRELAEAQKKIESLQNSLAALAFAEEEIRALRDDPKVMPRGRQVKIECDSGWDD